MIYIIFIPIGAAIIYFLIKILAELKVISADTKVRSDLNDALDKFAALAPGLKDQKKKVVAFKVKDDSDA